MKLYNGKLIVVAEAIELIAPALLGKIGGASVISGQVLPSFIEQFFGKSVVDTSENKCSKDKAEGQHESPLKMEDVKANKRKRANKSVQISSDDEEHLEVSNRNTPKRQK